MAQPRISKSSRSGGRFARKPLAESASFEASLDVDDIEMSEDDHGGPSDDRSWMDISEERRKALLEELDVYLAELAAKVGEPSAKHIARAEALMKEINGA